MFSIIYYFLHILPKNIEMILSAIFYFFQAVPLLSTRMKFEDFFLGGGLDPTGADPQDPPCSRIDTLVGTTRGQRHILQSQANLLRCQTPSTRSLLSNVKYKIDNNSKTKNRTKKLRDTKTPTRTMCIFYIFEG